MAIDLTGVKANLNNIKRNLFFDETLTCKLISENKTALELTSGWYLSKFPTSTFSAGGEFYELSIVDEDGQVAQIAPVCEAVVIGSNRYEIKGKFEPQVLTKEWKVRLLTTSKQV